MRSLYPGMPKHRVLWMLSGLALATACAAGAPAPQVDVEVEDATFSVPAELTFRARLTALTPPEPTDLNWRHGGEGLGGNVVRGTVGKGLALGQWSPSIPVVSLVKGAFPKKLFVTFTFGNPGKPRSREDRTRIGYSRDTRVEFEFRYRGQVVKRFEEAGPDGGTVGIVLPAYRLTAGVTPADAVFTDELTGIAEYAARRAQWLEQLPWAKWPVPKRLAVVTNIGGYGVGSGYGIRHTNRQIVETECRSLRQLGVNSLRDPPDFLAELVAKRQGYARDFARMRIGHAMGYPVPVHRVGRQPIPEAGCPFAAGVADRTAEGVAQSLELLNTPVEEVWALTVDEIGAVVDRSPEKKGHLAVCPKCAEGFRAYLREQGLTPADVGAAEWTTVRPLDIWGPKGGPPAAQRWGLEDPRTALLAYYTAKFNNYASARLFTPLRDAFAAANQRKREALAAGQTDSEAARQPWLYSYALRGNTFLMKGHSLDFFEFYRHADNAFVYETSNRGPQIWQWDSYLCDVGRVVSAKQQLQFGVYVKPHRGAPVQRALSAVSRGATMLYWYTYGPDYKKGDSFSQSWEPLALTSKAAHLIGRAEEALADAEWAQPPRIAIVKSRSSEIWRRLSGDSPAETAAWENAKWIYTALAHAHLQVDPLDEVLLATEDLSRYDVLYINGPNLTRAAAQRVAAWVEAGGTLYTSGGGLARDEANQPLTPLAEVLGLTGRRPPEMWYRVNLYGATRLEPYDDPRRVLAPVPPDAEILAAAPYPAVVRPLIGREVLLPAADTEVLARFADGKAAMTRHVYGKGQACTVGFFPGLEYSATVRNNAFDMSSDYDDQWRTYATQPALERVQPTVTTSQPTVEALLLRSKAPETYALSLMNWTYAVRGQRKSGARLSPVVQLVPFDDLEVRLPGIPEVRSAHSTMLDCDLPLRREAGSVRLILPRLEEGEVVTLRGR